MPQLLASLLALLLRAWPAHTEKGSTRRSVRGRRRASRQGDADAQDPVEAPERARARTLGLQQWPGEVVFSAGERRAVVRGRWRLTLDPMQRAQASGDAGRLSLDPDDPEVWETELEALLTLQVKGARLQIAHADRSGWQLLEVRAPTTPETVVHLDKASLAHLFDCNLHDMQVSFRVLEHGAT